jgi:putative peptide zinc metalloprotease protein
LRPLPISDEVLSSWTGSPLDRQNLGANLESDTLLCLIGDPREFEATFVIEQASIEFVRPGQCARVQLDALPGNILTGRIAELSEVDLESAPFELIATGLLPSRKDAQGNRRPIRTSYLARVELDDHDEKLLISATGRAKISVAPRSLATRVIRYLQSTFRFDW